MVSFLSCFDESYEDSEAFVDNVCFERSIPIKMQFFQIAQLSCNVIMDFLLPDIQMKKSMQKN